MTYDTPANPCRCWPHGVLPFLLLQALGALSGRWKLVYTSSTQTLLLLNALDALPLVDIGDVYQV